MAIFRNKKAKEETIKQIKMATAPEEPETKEEIDYVKNLSQEKTNTTTDYKEVPVCLSQAQINNMIIENNIMLKEIISSMDE